MSDQNQTAAQALTEVRLRQLKPEILAAQTAQRVALRAAAKAVCEQLKSELKLTLKKIAADLKVAITQSDADIAARFRNEAEAAAASKTISTSIARRDIGRGDKSLADFPPTYTEPTQVEAATVLG